VLPAVCLGLGVVLFAASRTVARDMRKLHDWYEQAEQVPIPEPAALAAGEAVAGR
jgi:hypothetical protein